MKKGVNILLLILNSLIGIYFSNDYLVLYLVIMGLFLFNLKSYYILILSLAFFRLPTNHFVGLLAVIGILLLGFKLKNKTLKLLLSYIIFSIAILLYAVDISNYIFIVISEIILFTFTLGMYFYFRYDLYLDYYFNKIVVILIVATYINYSNSSMLGYYMLLVSFTGRRDFFILPLIGGLALYYDFGNWPLILFYIAMSVKKLPTMILLSLLSIYILKTDYLLYFPIILNLLYFLTISRNKNPSIINEKDYSSYIAEIEKKSNNLEQYDELDNKILELIKSYCLNCQRKKECFSRKRISLYHYFMFELCQNMPQTKEIEYFIYNCEYKSMMDEHPKIAFTLNSNYKSLKEILSFEQGNSTFSNHVVKCLKGYNLKEIRVLNSTNAEATLSFNDYVSPGVLRACLGIKNLVIKRDGLDYKIHKKAKIKVKAESLILSKGGGYISGDNCLIVKTNTDFYAALSDGMGSGLKAYEASKSVLSRLNSLINLGLKKDEILKALTHLTQISLYSNSYATLDMLHINLTDAKGTLYKVASEETIFIRNHKIEALYTNTLPIEYDNMLDSFEFEFRPNDLILIISDGVMNFIDRKALYSFILAKSYLNPDKFVYQIGKYIYDCSNKRLQDDTSILAIKIE